MIEKQKNLDTLKHEKVDLEQTLEKEQEALVNRLWKKMDKLEKEKLYLQQQLGQPLSLPPSPIPDHFTRPNNNLSGPLGSIMGPIPGSLPANIGLGSGPMNMGPLPPGPMPMMGSNLPGGVLNPPTGAFVQPNNSRNLSFAGNGSDSDRSLSNHPVNISKEREGRERERNQENHSGSYPKNNLRSLSSSSSQVNERVSGRERERDRDMGSNNQLNQSSISQEDREISNTNAIHGLASALANYHISPMQATVMGVSQAYNHLQQQTLQTQQAALVSAHANNNLRVDCIKRKRPFFILCAQELVPKGFLDPNFSGIWLRVEIMKILGLSGIMGFIHFVEKIFLGGR